MKRIAAVISIIIILIAIPVLYYILTPKQGHYEAAPANQESQQNISDSRDPWLWPFSQDSIWNTPIGSEAVYLPANIEPALHNNVDWEIFVKTSEKDPEKTLYQAGHWKDRDTGTKVLRNLIIPDHVIVQDANDGWQGNACAAILQPDGRTFVNICALCRPYHGSDLWGYILPDTDLYGDGTLGAHAGSGLSTIGGSIRLRELTGDSPIRHVLKINLWQNKFLYYDRNSDTPGYRWPAVNCDEYAPTMYGGKNPSLEMGALLAIPPDVTEESLGLKTDVGRKLFHALQDYGAYVVDACAGTVVWNSNDICAERGVQEELELNYNYNFSHGDLQEDFNSRLLPALHIVDNNSPSNVGGGGIPRAPLAPPLTRP